VDNFAGASQGSVYFDYVLDHNSAKQVFLFRSTAGGTNWTKVAQLGFAAGGAQVAIGTNHEVFVVWKEITNGGTTLKFTLSKSSNLGTNFSAPVDILTNNFAGYDLQLTRSNSSDPGDYFSTPITPVLSVNPVTSHLYLVYHDKPSGASGDKADIFFLQSTNGGTNWSAPIRVNSDSTTNDQWEPAITVKPDGTKLFIAWYDRRNDIASNSLIQTYGVFASLPVTGTSSFATNFPISTVTFPPAFAGTTRTNAGQFDPAYPPDYGQQDPRCCQSFQGTYASHVGEYEGAASDNAYVYYTWSDNRNTVSFHGQSRNQPDIRFVRVSWPH